MREPTKRRALWSAAVVIAALVAFRLYLPTFVLRKVNQKLGGLEGYRGHADKIVLRLWRGAYQIRGLQIEKTGGQVPVPFFSAKRIDFSVEWRALLRHKIVTEIKMFSPEVNFVKGPTEASSATQPNESFATTLKGLAPFDIDRLTVTNGQIHYRDFTSSPKVDIALSSITAVALNLTNAAQAGVALPADIRIDAKAFGTGDLSIGLKANPLKDKPTFELKQTLNGVELTRLNDFFEAYAKVRAKKGTFGLYAEADAKDGDFAGYAKPFFKDLVLDKGTHQSVGKEAWAVVASAVKWVFSNKRKKQVATRIPFRGKYDDPKIGTWTAIGGVFKNAYIKALTPTLEGEGLKDIGKGGTKGGSKK